MNLALLLVAALAGGPQRPSLAWRLLAAVAVLSLEFQIVSLVGGGGMVLPLNLSLAAAAVATRAGRIRARRRLAVVDRGVRRTVADVMRVIWPPIGARPPQRSVALAWAGLLVAAAVALRGLLYVPTAADPYHLMKVDLIARHGDLRYVPALDSKINVFSFLYELVLADVVTVPAVGPILLRLHGFWSLLGFVALIAWCVRKYGGDGHRRHVWIALLLLPPFFHQFVLVKNDFFVFLIAFAGFVVLHDTIVRRRATASEACQLGVLGGLALAVKATAFPLIALALAATPAGSLRGWIRSRTAVLAGAAAGCAIGGIFYTAVQNLQWYGSVLGPQETSGNFSRSIGDAATSVARFSLSLVDWGLATPYIWPDRGGWGSNFGPLFVVLSIAAVCTGTERRRGRIAAALAAGAFLLFSATYPDADLAHRMTLAPAFLVAVHGAAALAGPAGPDRRARRLHQALLVVVALAFAQIVRSAATYARQFDHLNAPLARVAIRLDPATARSDVWQMRVARAAMPPHEEVCNVGQEHHFLLAGVPYRQVAITGSREDGYAVHWNVGLIDRCRVAVAGPDRPPFPPDVIARLERCDDPVLPGRSRVDEVALVRCRDRRGETFDHSHPRE